MYKSLKAGFYLCFLLFYSTHVIGQTENQNTFNFNKLKWLEGCWKIENSPENTFEEWYCINDTLMLGRSYSIISSDTITSEKITIRKTVNGIFYIAEVANQNNEKAVSFKFVKDTEKNTFKFENQLHDFPKSIIYRQLSKKSCIAWIEGNGNRFEFKMKKIK